MTKLWPDISVVNDDEIVLDCVIWNHPAATRAEAEAWMRKLSDRYALTEVRFLMVLSQSTAYIWVREPAGRFQFEAEVNVAPVFEHFFGKTVKERRILGEYLRDAASDWLRHLSGNGPSIDYAPASH